MERIQVLVASSTCVEKVRGALAQDRNWRVLFKKTPDPNCHGVVVMDQGAFDRMQTPLQQPDRFVLITRNEPELLDHAWNAGITSVIFEGDPAETLLLAIQAALLRMHKRN